MKAKLIKQELGYILFDEKGIPIGHTPNVLNNNTFSKLSMKNCQAIELGYDLDELYDEVDKSMDYSEFDFTSFKLGFQKALETLGDKKFTKEGMVKIFDLGFDAGVRWENGEDKITLKEHIQSLQQTEWDVEVKMEVVPDFDSRSDQDGAIFTSNKKEVPKLDVDGCLILKLV